MSSVFWKQPYHSARRILAKNWLKLNSKVKIIGITGSFGKTNTTRAIFEVLSQKAPSLQTDLNLDTIYNLPITILKLRKNHKFLILEMGVDHRGEMSSYLKYVSPSIGVVTGITPVHSDHGLLGSLEGIMEEKGRLLENLTPDGWAVLNGDDESVRKMAGDIKAQVLWYGSTKDCDLWAEKINVDFDGTSFVLHHDNWEQEVKIGLVGKHFVLDALAAAGVGNICGLSCEQIIAGLEKLKPLSGRLSIEKGPKGTILLDDHLRANPASTLAGLETLATLPHRGSSKKIAVLGEMGELGEYAEIEHKKIGKAVAKLKIDLLVGIGPLQKLAVEEGIKNGMKKENAFWVKDVAEAAQVLEKVIGKGDILYLKGSLKRHLERVILLLEGEKVCCTKVTCEHYHQCLSCPQLKA